MQFSHNGCEVNSFLFKLLLLLLWPKIRHYSHQFWFPKTCINDAGASIKARNCTSVVAMMNTPRHEHVFLYSATIKSGQRAEMHAINAGRGERGALTDTMVEESRRWCAALRRMWPLNPLLCRGWRQGRVRETERRAPGETKAADRLGSGSSGEPPGFCFFIN